MWRVESAALTTSVKGHVASAARTLGPMPLRVEQRNELVAMIALHLDYAIFHRAAGSACRSQLLSQRGECNRIQCDAANERDALSTSAFGFTRNAHRAGANGRQLGLRFARALSHRVATVGTHTSRFGGINQTAF